MEEKKHGRGERGDETDQVCWGNQEGRWRKERLGWLDGFGGTSRWVGGMGGMLTWHVEENGGRGNFVGVREREEEEEVTLSRQLRKLKEEEDRYDLEGKGSNL